MWRFTLLVVGGLGCGRVAFDPLAGDGSLGEDTRNDGLGSDGSTVPFGYVQGESVISNPDAMQLAAMFMAPQQQDSVNVVVVASYVGVSIASVTDTAGNVYTRAIGPTSANPIVQWMYTAVVNNALAANSVTVTFDQPAQLPGIMIAEYAGVSTTATVHATSGGMGNSATSSSGPVTVTVDSALLVAANTNALPGTAGPGPGFTQRFITGFEDILEDRVVDMPGTYTATAPLTSSHTWVMQVVALAPR